MFGSKTRRAAFTTAVLAGVLAVFGLALMTLTPSLVSEGELRRVVSEALARTTGGQHATIGGAPPIALLPAPAVVLDKVTFPMPGRFALDAEGAVARLRLLPLLMGRVEVADVTLERPTLVVTGKPPAFTPALVSLISGPKLPELRLRGGTIAIRNTDGLTEELISGIEADIERSPLGGGVKARVVFTWRDRETQADLDIADAPTFIAGRLTDTRFELTSGESWLHFKGQAAAGLSARITGDLSGEAPVLRALADWAGVRLPIAGGFKRFAFSGKVAGDRDKAQISPLKLDLDGNRSEGALSLRLDGSTPTLEGTFAADAIDLSPYGPISMTESRGGDWDRSRLNPNLLSRFNLDLRLSAARMRIEDSIMERVATSAMLRSGHLVLALGTAQAWGGTVRASLDVMEDPQGKGMALRFKGDGTGIALDRALGDLLAIRRIEGVGDLEADLSGTGRSYFELAQSLSGQVNLQAANGSVTGIDVAQVMRRIERRPLSGGGDLRGGRTPFDRLTARISLASGVATVHTADILGKQVNLLLKGEVDVGARDIDLQGHAILLTSPSGSERQGPPFDLPFIIQGSWQSPFVMLDPRSLIERSGAAQPLLEAVRNRGPVGEAAVRTVIEQLAKPTALPPAPDKTAN
ncbi:MAG: hypothetical protein B7Y71_00280 [Xanthobacter sp. 35-67-6]|nr:MAG: hypothetical protein B7Y71_00280 [Xanthobacter sp. 35-67-6]